MTGCNRSPHFLPSLMLIAVYFRHLQTASSVLNPSYTSGEANSPCAPGFFPCNGSDQCVEQRRNCDGTVQCDDGSDEWGCEDRFRANYWNVLFRKRPDEDREKNVQECSLLAVPEECVCSGQNLYCEHRGLTKVPFPVSRKVLELDLSGSRIQTLRPDDFPHLDFLTTLILTTSEVEIVEAGAFQKLPKLENLYLTGNKISVLQKDTFAQNENMKLLIISHNPLVQLYPRTFNNLRNLKELDMKNCKLRLLPQGIFDPLTNLEKLFLDENELAELTKNVFSQLSNLLLLSISKNKIYRLEGGSLFGLEQLRSLSFSFNNIQEIEDFSFGNMSSLLKLDLEGNKIKHLTENTFKDLKSLQSLNLKGNSLRKLDQEVFSHLQQLHYIYFAEFSFCSYALHVRVCEPQGDGISSVAHLLDNVLLRVSVWIVAFLALAGNAVVLLGRLLVKETNEVHSFYIKNLALADLVMGAYLFVIAGYDVAFRGEYIKHDVKWRHSWQCGFSGFLSTGSTEASVFILTIITVDRYVSIVYPLSVKSRTMKFAGTCIALVWAAALLLAALPLMNIEYFGNEFYGNNGVCLPLHIHKPFSQAWEYSTFMFCGLNMAAFFFIFFAYISMFFTISSSRIGLRSTQHHQQQDKAIAKRFAFIVATDFLCWVPIVLIKTLSMAGVPIDAQLNAWVAVFLLPVNSALNPILYTLTTKLFKQQIARIVYSCRESVQPFSRGDTFRVSSRSSRSSKKTMLAAFSLDNDNNSKSVLLAGNSRGSSLRSHSSSCQGSFKKDKIGLVQTDFV